jgi:SAM-dependent methyltransferase
MPIASAAHSRAPTRARPRLLLALHSCHPRGRLADAPEPIHLDIEYVPTPYIVVDKMLEAANLSERDVLYDLGCGDGRVVIAAALNWGARAVGFDLDPARLAEARANVAGAECGDLVEIVEANLLAVDLRPATVVTLYLSPELNLQLLPALRQLAPGSRIITHDFLIGEIDPEELWTVVAEHFKPRPKEREHHVLRWTTPLIE